MLSISLDPNIAYQTYADAHTRHVEYAKAFVDYTVVVLNRNSELRTQDSGVRSQESEVRNQKSEIRSQKKELGIQNLKMNSKEPKDAEHVSPPLERGQGFGDELSRIAVSRGISSDLGDKESPGSCAPVPFTKGEEIPSRHDFHFNNLHVYLTNVVWKPWAVVKAVWLGLRLHRRYHFDVVTAQDPLATGLVAWVLAAWLKLPLVVQIHEAYYFEKSNRLIKIWVWWILGRSQAVRVVNPIVQAQIQRHYPQLRVEHIPMMIDVDFFYQAVKPKNNYDRFISVARLVKSKNMDLLINAFSQVVKKYPNVRLTICGEGPESEKLNRACRQAGAKNEKLGMEKKIRFTGMVDRQQLRELYHQHDGFVLASEHEGWGNVFVEAAAAGLPIISTNVGAVKVLLKDKKTGLLIKVGDEKGLVRRLEWVIRNPTKATNVAKRAQTLIMKQFDKEKLKKDWIELLKNA